MSVPIPNLTEGMTPEAEEEYSPKKEIDRREEAWKKEQAEKKKK